MFSMLLTTTEVPKILKGGTDLCTTHTGLHASDLGKLLKTVTWQFYTTEINKLPWYFWTWYHNSNDCECFPSPAPYSKAHSVPRTAPCRAESGKPEVCRSFLYEGHGKLCVPYAISGVIPSLLKESTARDTLPFSSFLQRASLVLVHRLINNYPHSCLTTTASASEGKISNPQILIPKITPNSWTSLLWK